MKLLLTLVLCLIITAHSGSLRLLQDAPPVRTVKYPLDCNPSNLLDLQCNFQGIGTSCPNYCHQSPKGDCIATIPDVVCDLQYSTLCPLNCSYNGYLDRCVPNVYNAGITCHLDSQLAECPTGCMFDYNLEKCVDAEHPCGFDYYVCPESDVVCEKTMKVYCPEGCHVDDFKCVPTYDMEDHTLCHLSSPFPKCPNGCWYDWFERGCKRTTYSLVDTICEPMVLLDCMGYNFNIDSTNFPHCFSDTYNYDSICANKDMPFVSLMYPLRLQDKYANVVCDTFEFIWND